MAYDPELAERIRGVLGTTPVTERRMFGGLAFLVGEHMAVVASGRGGLMVRVDADQAEQLVDTTPAEYVEMRGRRMRNWIRIDTDQLGSSRDLSEWVEIGTTFAASLS